MISSRHHGARKALWLSSLLFAFMAAESSLRGALRYASPDYGRNRQLGMEKSTSSDDKSDPALNHKDYGIPSSDSGDKSKDNSNDKSKSKNESKDESKSKAKSSKDTSKGGSKDDSKGGKEGKSGSMGGRKEKKDSKSGSKGDSKGKSGPESGSKGSKGSKGDSKDGSKGKAGSQGKKGSKSDSKDDNEGKSGSESSSKGSKGSKGGSKDGNKGKGGSQGKKGSKSGSKDDSEGKSGSESGSKGSKGSKGGSKDGNKGKNGSKGKSNSSPGKSNSKSDSKPKPTSKPASEPAPTSAPTPSPTSAPTPSPTSAPTPTQVPTTRPVPEPTMNPTEKVNRQQECDVNSNGSFGVTSSGRQELYFNYQVETIPSATQDLLDITLLPLVESAIDRMLLASLFTSCGETITRKLQKNHWLQVHGQMAAMTLRQEPTPALSDIQGYSSLPIDSVLPGAPCSGTREAPANNCFVIVGGSSLYIAEGADSSAILDRAKGDIMTSMESGAFNSLDDRIVNVTYLEDAFEEDPNTPGADPSTSTENDESLPLWATGVAIGSALAFVLLGLFSFLCMRRRRMDKGSFPADEDVVNDFPLPESEFKKPYYDQEPLSQDSTEQLPQEYTHPTCESDDDDSTEPLPKDYTPASVEGKDEDSTELLPRGVTPPSGETGHKDQYTPSAGKDHEDNTFIVN